MVHSLPFLSTFRYKRLNAYQYTRCCRQTQPALIFETTEHTAAVFSSWASEGRFGSEAAAHAVPPDQWCSTQYSFAENPAGFSIQHSQHFHYQAGKAARAWLGATVKDATATASGADTLCPPQSLTAGEKSGSPKFQATSTVLGSFHLTEQHWCLTYTSKQK